MKLYKSILAYDGTDFHGFQRQLETVRTVQGELETGLRKIGWQGESILAAGRTDSGVHARGQVVAFKMAWDHGQEVLQRAVNASLPADMAVSSIEVAADDFHPRFSATSRCYRYSLFMAALRDPLRERYAWRVWPRLTADVLNQIGAEFLGRHDFGAFGTAPIEGGHTQRHVMELVWSQEGDRRWVDIRADAFLYHMVRRVVGATLDVAYGKRELEELQASIADPGLRWESGLAPAHGLCLEDVRYD
jgi:tRNA pseudouridine38-40 synthase